MNIGNAQLRLSPGETFTGSRLSLNGWLEILALSALSAILHTISSFFTDWPSLAIIPLAFIALRQGSSAAVIGGSSWILMCTAFHLIINKEPHPFSLENLGPILVSLLCGYFSDYWNEKQVATQTAKQHNALLLDEVTQSHHLLQLSHARLEQRVVGGVDTLRESLQRLHSSLFSRAHQELPLAERGPELLLQFDSLTWIQSASLHMVGLDERFLPQAAAEIGDPPPLHIEEALVIAAIAQRKMLAVTDLREKLNEKSPLVVAPIVDNDNHVRAIVCVHKVPFLAFNRENLALMAVLAAHLGHMISTTERVGSKDSNEIFTQSIGRACEDAKNFGLPSTLAQWTFKSSEMALTAANFIRDNVRGLDHPLLDTFDNATRLTLLCSLTDRSEFNSLQERLQQLLVVRYAIDLSSNVSDFKLHTVSKNDSPTGLISLMNMSENG